MTYSIALLRSADKFLSKLVRQQPSDAQNIEEAIQSLAESPHPPGCEQLKGYSGIFRIRVGNYRICYRVDGGELLILVIVINERNEIHQELRRHLGR
ncbi:type II toxin-antitoxin system RelE/ParE family toxin [Arthrobacter sp. EH-1B-1]|uniref:Type II toxin-antitoxin system RelE/ParE family toxin n=1 Tax=Arthrobacter vasquezii TaxID=2977629 RepID=A0ABT6CSN1_9MICC|nr:type II toxin-antitoxin system RelE/ParE family toxin [Arthrobacter vasquezii]MDF9276905.1 type II toxin-antitoxin system RelE/ParE family toxin [Arthrobacter vasquezii]